MKHKCVQCGKIYNADQRNYDEAVFCPFCGFYKDGSGYSESVLSSKPTPKDLLWPGIPTCITIFFLWFGSFIYPTNGYLLWYILGFLFALLAWGGITLYCGLWKEYNLAKSDYRAFLQYKAKKDKELRENLERIEQERKEKERKEQIRISKLPPCPICGSKEYVKRITTLDRSVSATVWGLGSSKIGKQYECTYCKHFF